MVRSTIRALYWPRSEGGDTFGVESSQRLPNMCKLFAMSIIISNSNICSKILILNELSVKN